MSHFLFHAKFSKVLPWDCLNCLQNCPCLVLYCYKYTCWSKSSQKRKLSCQSKTFKCTETPPKGSRLSLVVGFAFGKTCTGENVTTCVCLEKIVTILILFCNNSRSFVFSPWLKLLIHFSTSAKEGMPVSTCISSYLSERQPFVETVGKDLNAAR